MDVVRVERSPHTGGQIFAGMFARYLLEVKEYFLCNNASVIVWHKLSEQHTKVPFCIDVPSNYGQECIPI
jgi:hypothetical protein